MVLEHLDARVRQIDGPGSEVLKMGDGRDQAAPDESVGIADEPDRPACTYPSDILSCQRVHNLLATPLDVVDSCIRVPDGPGLGVELDEDALQRYTVT